MWHWHVVTIAIKYQDHCKLSMTDSQEMHYLNIFIQHVYYYFMNSILSCLSETCRSTRLGNSGTGSTRPPGGDWNGVYICLNLCNITSQDLPGDEGDRRWRERQLWGHHLRRNQPSPDQNRYRTPGQWSLRRHTCWMGSWNRSTRWGMEHTHTTPKSIPNFNFTFDIWSPLRYRLKTCMCRLAPLQY